MSNDKGWEYLNSGESGSFHGADGSWGYIDEDGSGSYHGADGSWGYRNSDGSNSYHGADGSWGYKNSDGSGSYHGADGSWGYTNSDGSGSYHGADGSWGYTNPRERTSADYVSSTSYDHSEYSSSSYSSRSGGGFKRVLRTISKILKIIKRIVISVLVVGIIGIVAYYFYENSKQIPVGFDSAMLENQHYETVVGQLVSAGFEDVTPQSLNDLSLQDEHLVGVVKEVSIDGENSFSSSTEYPYDAEVIVYYHSIKMLLPPMSARDAKGKTSDEVLASFRQAGFENIKTEELDDLLFGWFAKDGEVESVSVDGKNSFDTEEKYRPDAEVIISYHTFASNKG